jgi:uncharacterized protein YegJ (DUF2314 family)
MKILKLFSFILVIIYVIRRNSGAIIDILAPETTRVKNVEITVKLATNKDGIQVDWGYNKMKHVASDIIFIK